MQVLIGYIMSMIRLSTFMLKTGWGALTVNIHISPWFVFGLLFVPFFVVVVILCRLERDKKTILKPVSFEEKSGLVLQLEGPDKRK
jgi:hypothetical protein